eukprot:TRINITY_DN3997_c0_g1_i1.p1 TRINITY_DN3997_c0_g1~~TRINITY_DN3997_c0_g1_i1.p1  ORF type:complete len:561 (-),score=105.55 TRINITY_DN3997_c0_g1_i1:56-1738(-)
MATPTSPALLFQKSSKRPDTVELDGNTLTIPELYRISLGGVRISLTDAAWEKVRTARAGIHDILDSGEIVYGITTGFGQFSDVVISKENYTKLQVNLIRSHAVGVGPAFSLQMTRAIMTLRINVLAKGYSGVSEQTLSQYIAAFNCGCLPLIPEQGTLGASGDLAPLAHLALGLMGEGQVWNPSLGQYGESDKVLAEHGLEPLELGPKEGLALINGTQMITGVGAIALYRAKQAAQTADYICALSLDALRGTRKAFLPHIHEARPHTGQKQSAAAILSVLHSDDFPSEIHQSHVNCSHVQDAYSLRCAPQVHGVVHDTIEFAWNIITTEMNSATDNPMIFQDGSVVSCGNFHGEYPAKVLDYLAIAIHEIANISECRVERMMNNHLSELPPFLTKDGGLNSGLMIMQCTAAALVSENKGLCHPSSVDSIPTSGQKEDHVSMGGWSARKCLKVVENVEMVLAVEYISACQAFEFLRPMTSTVHLEALYDMLRTKVPLLEEDRYLKPDMEAACSLVRNGRVLQEIMKSLESAKSVLVAPKVSTPQQVPVSASVIAKESTVIL